MLSTMERVQQELQRLVGLELTVACRAADMFGLSFGVPGTAVETGDEVALHIQCSWRLDGPEGVVTGRSDLWEAADGTLIDPDTWDYDQDHPLQDRRIGEWLGTHDRRLGSRPPPGRRPAVLAVRATAHGGAEIDLTDGYRLTLFPAGSVGEDW